MYETGGDSAACVYTQSTYGVSKCIGKRVRRLMVDRERLDGEESSLYIVLYARTMNWRRTWKGSGRKRVQEESSAVL